MVGVWVVVDPGDYFVSTQLQLWFVVGVVGCDNTKEKLVREIFKSLSFGIGCSDFAQFFFQVT